MICLKRKKVVYRMKELMIGNAALARGLYEAGCSLISSYPGTPSTEITEEFAKFDDVYCEWAPNEKVAAETAFGAALRGKRSACCMKHVGLNVAADLLFTVSYSGINAGRLVRYIHHLSVRSLLLPRRSSWTWVLLCRAGASVTISASIRCFATNSHSYLPMSANFTIFVVGSTLYLPMPWKCYP